jgi:hypothetical protein
MKRSIEITPPEIDNLTKKLEEFGATLNDKENTILMGILELAGKSLLDVDGNQTAKKKLTLVRENIRDLNVWDLLLDVRAHSLWACPDLELGEDVINPPDPL